MKEKYGLLTVIKKSPDKDKVTCLCECGNTKDTYLQNLKRGVTKSCGCLWLKAMTTHGMAHSSEYSIWQHIKGRCNNPNNDRYHSYGGRGIQVCPEWNDSFETFYKDMGPRPSPDHSIDRKDNDGNYTPSNCRWATRREQQSNMRSNRRLTYNGKTKTMSEWARVLGVKPHTITTRLTRGWSVERALSTPGKS